jgi:hypothetical protein
LIIVQQFRFYRSALKMGLAGLQTLEKLYLKALQT